MIKYSVQFLKVFFIIILLAGCQERKLLTQFPLDNYDQTISTWFDPKSRDYDTSLLDDNKQKKYYANFYDHVFGIQSPWDQNHIQKIIKDDLSLFVRNIIKDFDINRLPDEGYGENYRKYDQNWIKTIVANINFTQLENIKFNNKNRAIAIDNSAARMLPTEEVYFYDYQKAGQGFPFDIMQTSALWAGTPLYILAETHDHVWSLVASPDFVAWVKNKSIARVSAKFVNEWRKAAKKQLAVVIKHHTSFLNKKDKLMIVANMGMVFPITKQKKQSYELMLPMTNQQQNASIVKVNVSKQIVAKMPLKATPHHFANLFAEMIDKPYGWGNLYFYNDCSAELKRLFTPFGIWLPRHSADQGNLDNHIDISQFSKEEKLAYLMQYGKPLLTIVDIGGHVFLYMGTYQDKYHHPFVMTYQNIWGLRPADNKSRTIIGKSVFLPLLLRYPEDPSLISLLEKKYFKVVIF